MCMQYLRFQVCPECSENEQPTVNSDNVYTATGLESQRFYAVCRTCGYETKRYDHVIDLLSAWNTNSAKTWTTHLNRK